ncbi:MAG: elongation factor G, partial [Candidatus Hydrogenedentes bacterium]|nr:elongation factor G [Candidatus Hydrogenedentota bacterium]
FNLIDCPGYADFVGETAAAVRVVDGLILVVDGVDGIQVGTDTAWEYATKLGIPTLVFINKLDRENANFSQRVNDIQLSYGSQCSPLCIPLGAGTELSGVASLVGTDPTDVPENVRDQFTEMREKMIDSIAEADDTLLEKYLEEGELSDDEIATGLLSGIKQRSVVPIMGGSGEKDVGVKEMLDFITRSFPAPLDRQDLVAVNEKGEETHITPTADGPFYGFVFKTVSDPYVGNLTLVRVYSGTLSSDGDFYNVTKRNKERVGGLLMLCGKEQHSVDKVYPGDIVAIPKLKNTEVSDTLASTQTDAALPPIEFPEPMVRLAIKPKSRADEDKLGQALHRIENEDHTFKTYRDNETHDQIIAGMGDLHLGIIVDRMKNRYNVEVTTSLPQVPYRETIKSKVQVQGRYKKQSGGRGQFGDVWIEVEPLERGAGFVFEERIVGGVVPRNYIPAVEKGIVEALSKGVVAGYQIVDIKVVLYDGSHHPVDSSDMAFKIAGSMAIQKAVEQAQNCLLEPIMDIEITVPNENMGDITGDLNSRRGRIMGMEPGIGKQTVKAQVPLAEVLRYSTDLRSITGGRASFKMSFSHYDEVPQRLADEIVARKQKEKDGE